MSSWNRWKTPRYRVVDASAEVDIFTTPQSVWSFVRPAENAVHIDPTTVRAFHVPGTPYGVGEIQGFITREGGRESIAMIEVIEEIDVHYALTRPIGIDDDALRMAYILHATESGTRLELRSTFTIPAELMSQSEALIGDARRKLHAMADRTKWILESGLPHSGVLGSSR